MEFEGGPIIIPPKSSHEAKATEPVQHVHPTVAVEQITPTVEHVQPTPVDTLPTPTETISSDQATPALGQKTGTIS